MLGKGWSAGETRAAMDSGLRLDECKRYLENLGFGPRELATLEISDSAAIARQQAFEMNITFSTELEETIVDWRQNAGNKRDYLLPRLRSDMVSLDRKMASYGDVVVGYCGSSG